MWAGRDTRGFEHRVEIRLPVEAIIIGRVPILGDFPGPPPVPQRIGTDAQIIGRFRDPQKLMQFWHRKAPRCGGRNHTLTGKRNKPYQAMESGAASYATVAIASLPPNKIHPKSEREGSFNRVRPQTTC